MANIKTWPASLPTPTISAANTDLDYGYLNSQMDSGLLRQRVNRENPTGTKRIEMVCDTMQSARLHSFLHGLQGASFDFDAIVPSSPENGLQTVSCRWMGTLRTENQISARDNNGVLRTVSYHSVDIFIERITIADDFTEEDYFYHDYYGSANAFHAATQTIETSINTWPAG